MRDIWTSLIVLIAAAISVAAQPDTAEPEIFRIGDLVVEEAPDARDADDPQLVDEPTLTRPDPYLQAFRQRPQREPSFGFFVGVGRPESTHARYDHLPSQLHEGRWSDWIQAVGLEDLPDQVGGRRVRVILRCPHPCPPGRIHARPWSSLPEHLQETMTDWRRFQERHPGVELVWYIGTPDRDVTVAELEAEILPIVAAAGCRVFALDAVRLRSTNVLERWAELCQRYDLDLMVEPFPVHLADDPVGFADRWKLIRVPTITLNLRWEVVVRRVTEGVIPPFRPHLEETTPCFVKGYGGLPAQEEAALMAAEVEEALDFGARHVAVNWYRWRHNHLLQLFVEAEVNAHTSDAGGSDQGADDPGGSP